MSRAHRQSLSGAFEPRTFRAGDPQNLTRLPKHYHPNPPDQIFFGNHRKHHKNEISRGSFVRQLVRVRAQRAAPAIRAAAAAGWKVRWWSMLSVAVQQAVASTALGGPWQQPLRPARLWMLCCSGPTLLAPAACPCGPELAAGSWRTRSLLWIRRNKVRAKNKNPGVTIQACAVPVQPGLPAPPHTI